MFSLKNNKAPGPDGFNAGFFKIAKELDISIRNNALRDPVKSYYLPKEQISNVSCIISFMTWNEVCHL
jgi:hypothetical protein